jgi:hypothetical protein
MKIWISPINGEAKRSNMAMCGHAISQHAFLMLELATAVRGRSFLRWTRTQSRRGMGLVFRLRSSSSSLLIGGEVLVLQDGGEARGGARPADESISRLSPQYARRRASEMAGRQEPCVLRVGKAHGQLPVAINLLSRSEAEIESAPLQSTRRVQCLDLVAYVTNLLGQLFAK